MTIAVINYIAFSRKINRVYIEMCNRSRIGNQMFFLAFGETLRKDLACCVLYHTNVKKDYCFLIDPFIYKKGVKFLTFKIPQNTIRINEKDFENYKDMLSFIKRKIEESNIYISGFYENIDYFNHGVAHKLFSCPLNIDVLINNLYGDLKEYVSVHVRRGDFVNLGYANNMSYYQKAMSVYDSNTNFVIISDDIEWCKEHFVGNNIIFADKHKHLSQSVYIDLYLPTKCAGNIISCSTFTWWSAFLNTSCNRIQIAPYPWRGYEYKKNIYTSKMIKMEI